MVGGNNLLAAIGVYLVVAVVLLFVLGQDYSYVQQLMHAPDSVDMEALGTFVASEKSVLSTASRLLLLDLAVYFGWLVGSTSLLRRHGINPREVLRHWALVGWRVGIMVSVVLFVVASQFGIEGPTKDALFRSTLRYDLLQLASTGVRVVMTVLLGIGIVAVRARIRNAVEKADRTVHPGGSHKPAGTLASASGPQVGPADDEFWAAVANLAGQNTATLALLESSGTTGRWYLLSSDVDIAAVRSRVATGATVTVYSQPPQPVDARTLGQVAGRVRSLARSGHLGGSVGLIEDGTTVHHDELSTEEQLVNWLARARTATWAGAYPVDPREDPASLSAIVQVARATTPS